MLSFRSAQNHLDIARMNVGLEAEPKAQPRSTERLDVASNVGNAALDLALLSDEELREQSPHLTDEVMDDQIPIKNS